VNSASDEESSIDDYELLSELAVSIDPPETRPIGPGDVFRDIEVAHLSVPFTGHVIVVGHPCSLRKGTELLPDVPVAPLVAKGLRTADKSRSDRLFPVGRLLPPNATDEHVAELVRTTTIAADLLPVDKRCAAMAATGVVALQQRVIGNQTRVKVPHGVISAHCRGPPVTELEVWTDWRDDVGEAGHPIAFQDEEFDKFMESASEFPGLTWREALAAREDAKGVIAIAMTEAIANLAAPDAA
jgi:hypothetical protein